MAAAVQEDRYKDVVWARSGNFPFWPSYIFDPKSVPTQLPEYEKAQKVTGKKYFVYFYTDGTLGFINPKDIRPFNEETIAQLANQKMNRKDANNLPSAIKEAQKDILLEKDRRLQFFYDKINILVDEDLEQEEGEEDQEEMDDEQESQEDSELSQQKSANKRKRLPESDDEASQQSENESEIDDQRDADDWSEGSEKKKSSAKKLKRRLSKTAVKDAGRSSDEAGDKNKRGRPSKFGNDDIDSNQRQSKLLKPQKKAQTASCALAVTETSSAFTGESKMDRLQRLAGILELTTDPSTFDEKRALKTLEKIKEIEGLQIQELKVSGLAKVMMAIKSHVSSAPIRSSASIIIDRWKQISGKTAPAVKSSIESSRKQPSSGSFVVDRVSRVQDSSVGSGVGQLLQKDGSSVLTAGLPLERRLSVHLLNDVIHDEPLTLSLEVAISEQLGYDSNQSSKQYFEAITRCFAFFKMKGESGEEVRKMVEKALQESQLQGFLKSIYTPFHPIASSST